MTSDSLAKQCEAKLEAAIMNGELAPGKRLNNSELAKQYRVTVSPIREALSRLTTTGLVEFIDKRGFFVTEVNKQQLFDIVETYLQIESLALCQAMLKGDDAWEANVTQQLYLLSKVETGKKKPFLQWNERNRAFHRALVSGCNSPSLMQCRDRLYRQNERYVQLCYSLTNTDTILANHKEHSALAMAVLGRKKRQALALLKHHLLSAQPEIIKKLDL